MSRCRPDGFRVSGHGDYCVLQLEDTGVVLHSHGHVHNPQCMPPLKNGDILLNGHTHVPACEKIADENGNEYMYLNPGIGFRSERRFFPQLYGL